MPRVFAHRSFVTVFTEACHWSMSWARWIHSTPSHPTSWRSIYTWPSFNIITYQWNYFAVAAAVQIICCFFYILAYWYFCLHKPNDTLKIFLCSLCSPWCSAFSFTQGRSTAAGDLLSRQACACYWKSHAAGLRFSRTRAVSEFPSPATPLPSLLSAFFVLV
jgi:hypothetical protein